MQMRWDRARRLSAASRQAGPRLIYTSAAAERVPDRTYRLLKVTPTTHVVETVSSAPGTSFEATRRATVSLPRVRFLES